MKAKFTLDVCNNLDHPDLKVSLGHDDFQPMKVTTVVSGGSHNAGAEGATVTGVNQITESMQSPHKICILKVGDLRVELKVDQLRYAVERL